jgi:hypothetical protein
MRRTSVEHVAHAGIINQAMAVWQQMAGKEFAIASAILDNDSSVRASQHLNNE